MEGDDEGVRSKGVEDCVVLTNSKFERLDVGLVLDPDGGSAILDGIGVRLPIGSEVDGGRFVKRPELSLIW